MRKGTKEDILTNDKKIIIELHGGTGNQLFQLAACYRIAKINKRQAFYTDHLLGEIRNLETESVAKKLNIKKLNNKELKNKRIINEKEMCHPAFFSSFPDTSYLPDSDLIISGYFQNYRIHTGEFMNLIRETSDNEYKLIKFKDPEYIAIHIRELQASGKENGKPLNRTDRLSINYYERSISLIRQLIDKNNLNINKALIFTDMFKNKEHSLLFEPIAKILKFNNFDVIEGDNFCRSALQAISLMSKAKYIVTSNSTFSWWAAYISKAKVITPILSVWEPLLLTPDSWIQINDGNLMPKTWHKGNIYKTGSIRKRFYYTPIKLVRKIMHILNHIILPKTFFSYIRKYNKLKLRSILS